MSGDSSDIWPGLGILLCIGSDDNSPKSPMTSVLIANVPRRFNPEWFKKYDWLEYSEKVDKTFCLYCYLFRDCIKGQGGNNAFVTKGFSLWNIKKRLDIHVGGISSYHNAAVKRCNNLFKPSQSIEFALSRQRDIAKEEYFI
jgi:hypothetical protein